MYPVSCSLTRCVVMIEHLWCDFVASINVATELVNILSLPL